jgi:hypothetical protein
MNNRYVGWSFALRLTFVLVYLFATASPARAQSGLTSFPEIRFSTNAADGAPLVARIIPPASLLKSVDPEVGRLIQSTSAARRPTILAQQASAEHRNWIQRHPMLFGALVGFGAGFLVGYLPGDDAVFEDFDAEFNGLVIGGIGAGAGALVGWGVSR